MSTIHAVITYATAITPMATLRAMTTSRLGSPSQMELIAKTMNTSPQR